jgi:hypothetical protein
MLPTCYQFCLHCNGVSTLDDPLPLPYWYAGLQGLKENGVKSVAPVDAEPALHRLKVKAAAVAAVGYASSACCELCHCVCFTSSMMFSVQAALKERGTHGIISLVRVLYISEFVMAVWQVANQGVAAVDAGQEVQVDG